MTSASEGDADRSGECREEEKQKAQAKRENNRIAQQRYRRKQRNELTLLRHKSVKYFEGEMELYEQLLRVSQEKNVVLAEAEAQERTVSCLSTLLDVECRLPSPTILRAFCCRVLVV